MEDGNKRCKMYERLNERLKLRKIYNDLISSSDSDDMEFIQVNDIQRYVSFSFEDLEAASSSPCEPNDDNNNTKNVNDVKIRSKIVRRRQKCRRQKPTNRLKR